MTLPHDDLLPVREPATATSTGAPTYLLVGAAL